MYNVQYITHGNVQYITHGKKQYITHGKKQCECHKKYIYTAYISILICTAKIKHEKTV